MKWRRKMFAAVSSLAVLAIVLLAGCGAPAGQETGLTQTGTLVLSVNPEIEIEYNKEGKVTALTGRNDDGKRVVDAYPDYIGKDCEAVLRDLVTEIHEAGYFVEEMDGNQKNIVLQLEPGSVLPDDRFLENMSASTQDAVKALNLSSGIVSIGESDYDPAYAKGDEPSPYITLEKAQEIALTQANVKAEEAVFEDKEFDHDDGTPVFELEFTAGGNEYEYDIHAVTGKVIKAEHQIISAPAESQEIVDDTDYGPNNDGVTDYNDTDYGPNNDGVTDYNDTDYGPNNDGVTDYNDTDYGPNNDGVTDYNDTDYGPNNDGVTDYDDSGNSGYGDSNYDDGGSDYSDDDDDDDD